MVTVLNCFAADTRHLKGRALGCSHLQKSLFYRCPGDTADLFRLTGYFKYRQDLNS